MQTAKQQMTQEIRSRQQASNSLQVQIKNLEAEADRQKAALNAEFYKQEAIVNADFDKQKATRNARFDREKDALNADADKEEQSLDYHAKRAKDIYLQLTVISVVGCFLLFVVCGCLGLLNWAGVVPDWTVGLLLLVSTLLGLLCITWLCLIWYANAQRDRKLQAVDRGFYSELSKVKRWQSAQEAQLKQKRSTRMAQLEQKHQTQMVQLEHNESTQRAQLDKLLSEAKVREEKARAALTWLQGKTSVSG